MGAWGLRTYEPKRSNHTIMCVRLEIRDGFTMLQEYKIDLMFIGISTAIAIEKKNYNV